MCEARLLTGITHRRAVAPVAGALLDLPVDGNIVLRDDGFLVGRQRKGCAGVFCLDSRRLSPSQSRTAELKRAEQNSVGRESHRSSNACFAGDLRSQEQDGEDDDRKFWKHICWPSKWQNAKNGMRGRR